MRKRPLPQKVIDAALSEISCDFEAGRRKVPLDVEEVFHSFSRAVPRDREEAAREEKQLPKNMLALMRDILDEYPRRQREKHAMEEFDAEEMDSGVWSLEKRAEIDRKDAKLAQAYLKYRLRLYSEKNLKEVYAKNANTEGEGPRERSAFQAPWGEIWYMQAKMDEAIDMVIGHVLGQGRG